MAGKHYIAMFVQNDGERVQVGWASPKNETGVRTFEYLPGYENTRARDVSFEDDELEQKIAEETNTEFFHHVEEEEVAPEDDEVELVTGGEITEVSDEADDEEAEFERELAEEQARLAENEETD